MGEDKSGAGGFYFDPWEFYNAGIFKGMSMLVLGAVGEGKSSLVKSFVSRQVLIGRKALVMSDRKGEWSIVSAYHAGKTIRVGSGEETRINPLDEGNRPSKDGSGKPMTNKKWAEIVADRRFALLRAIAEILMNRELNPTERLVLGQALNLGLAAARAENRKPIIPDVVVGLEKLRSQHVEEYLRQRHEAAAILHDSFLSLVSTEDGAASDISGMFDGESTVDFDVTAPIVTFDTSGLESLSKEARKIAHACIQTWAEAAITSNDFGKRIVVYEEGLEVIDDIGSLNRMTVQYKLARHYGIFNILVLHKLGDLNLAGDEGSKARASAFSLLGDSPVRVLYRQEAEEEELVKKTFGLSHREWEKVASFSSGRGLWKLGNHAFEVQNTMTAPERPVFDTNKSMRVSRDQEQVRAAV
ncbi:conjugal transfer protein TraC [Rothia sp. P5764]|uniref:conjugal transfer protein TraC n=1 Tax=Rothia sp. P5764 TaxID=3402654 RepID=UPI003ACF1787